MQGIGNNSCNVSRTSKTWFEGDDKETVDVKTVFPLAVNKKEEQATFLSKFSQFICDSQTIEKILTADDRSYVVSILKDRLC
ncbi:PTS sugar transporter subunit IIA [Thermoanaerobacter wiegelii]|uniref:PTS sugar transporter subunit IIA n=1 Tax=Thermoanaerobacter wiegelii TaxID=46354 RepID=UPI0009FD14AD|nr:PTS sugar transporter subunit IIA [Thermoanaerobacter wiegelii]